jgi:S-adenosylmethionine:tRNA ribosyltransferase-isomerase
VAEEFQVADYRYDLPRELIAQHPLPERDAARLLVLDRRTGAMDHRLVRELTALLRPGDLVIFNQSRVIPARLFGYRQATGGQWEGLFLREHPDGVWELLSQTRGYLRPGEFIRINPLVPAHSPGGRGSSAAPKCLLLEVVGRTPEHHLLVLPREIAPSPEPSPPKGEEVAVTGPSPLTAMPRHAPARGEGVLALLERFGHVPIPPYIRKGVAEPDDRERYQTVFAKDSGSVAAPTAGLHFTPALLQRLRDAGVELACVTLHVGLGTFQPLQEEHLRTDQLHEERWQVPAETATAWENCRARGGRIIAVGTTTARTLESACQDGKVQAGAGVTRLFIHPPYQFKTMDGLMTNFHLPESSLLMLVCAFAGRERVLSAYAEAARLRYRFYSYGDAMLIL